MRSGLPQPLYQMQAAQAWAGLGAVASWLGRELDGMV
jgi:hypothetical protein